MPRCGRLLTDAQWEKIRPLLPKAVQHRHGGRPRADDRKVLEGILWILRSGARWQDLPDQFPHPSTCWWRLRDWEEQSSGNAYKFTGKERDPETGLDNFGARHYASTLGRFIEPDPLYLELRRRADPQPLNLYTYTRNNPLQHTDPTGLDIKLTCEDKKDCKQTVQDLNKREGKQFEVKQGKNGLLEVKGKVDPSKLSNSELALYEAITDKDNHATLNVVRQSDEVDFDRFDGNGTNRIDRSDMNLLAKQDQSLAGHIVAHAALEAYANARYGVGYEPGSLVGAHGYASNFFAGASIAGPLIFGTTFHMSFNFPTKAIEVIGVVTSPQPEFRGNITQVEVRRIP
jgi:RHS repeat-associated protein